MNLLERMTRDELSLRLGELRRTMATSDDPSEVQTARLEHAEAARAYQQKQQQHERIRQVAANPANCLPASPRAIAEPVGAYRSEYVGTARRSIDRLYAANEIDEASALTNEERVRHDRTGALSRYMAAVAAPEYQDVFLRMLASAGDPTLIRLGMTDRHYAAMAEAQESMRQLNIGDGGPGGSYAVPFTLDPTLMLTSNFTTNPIRGLARKVTLGTAGGNTWKGVVSGDVVASFDDELTETDDDKPTLGQVEIPVEKAQAFVPFSIEIDQDWPALRDDLFRLFQEAKDQLEASKFLAGAGHGSHEPEGLLTGATEHVTTSDSNKLADVDVYALKSSLGARFQANATFLGSPAVFDITRQMTGPGSTQGPIWSDGPPATILRRPAVECYEMDSDLADGTAALIYGDIGQFIIADKIGLSVELIPHLFGGTRGYPVGARGLYCYYRTGSVLAVDNAVRVLRVKS
jgi:HK97 family phage major capsid protein